MTSALRTLLRGRWGRVALITVLSLVSGALQAFVLVLIVKVATVLAGGDQPAEAFSLGTLDDDPSTLIKVAVVLVVGLAIADAVASWLSADVARFVTARAQRGFLDAYFSARWSTQDAHPDGELQLMMDGQAMSFGTTAMTAMAGLVALGNFVALSVIALLVFPLATIVAVVAVGVLLLLVRPLSMAVRRISNRVNLERRDFSQSLAEVEHSSREVTTYDVRKSVERRLTESTDALLHASFRRNLFLKIGPSLFRNAALLLVVLTIGVVYWLDISAVGSLAAVVLLLVRSLSYAQGVQSAQQNLHDGLPNQEIFWDTRHAYLEAEEDPSGDDLGPVDEVAFDDVGFSYPGSDVPALTGVNLRCGRGGAIGIVGPSGAGKSTFVQLLLRLRDPAVGEISMNGRPIQDYSRPSFRQRVAFVPQEPTLVRGTIAENIAFFRVDVSSDRIELAAAAAGLTPDLAAMPDGLQTEVTQRGGSLSGGQRQRIAIARALLADPDVLVLDEPTSALDGATEAAVQETLRSLSGRVTLFIVAHRLSTLQACDRILVIERGRVTAFGSSAEVADTNDFYREAVRLSRL